MVISYTLTTASLMLACGRAGDLFGHKHVFQAGCACSAAAFVLCTLAPSYVWLLVFRAVQGVGAGLVLSCGPALITGLYAETERARALGLYSAGFAGGGALGALLAGILIARFGWSVVFWARAPLAVLAGVLAIGLPSPLRGAGRGGFDVAGAALLMLTVTACLLALNRIRDPILCVCLTAVTVLGIIGFIRRERRFAHPIIDIRLFRNGAFASANMANLLINLAGFAVPLLVPFQLARLPGLSVAQAGALLALSSVGMIVGASLAGRLALRMSPRTLLLGGAGLVTVGLFAVAGLADGAAGLAGAMLIQGAGQGVFQVAYFDLVTGMMPVEHRGVAGSLGMLTRSLGLVCGASLLVLTFETMRSGAGFAGGFRGAVLCAAAVAAVVFCAGLLRSLARARST